MLREASDELMTAFRGAADRIVAAQRAEHGAPLPEKAAEYGVVLDHLYRAVQHLQSHDLVNQLIDAQKLRVDKMREKLGEAISLATPPIAHPGATEQWIERSRAMLDCIVAGIKQIDEDTHAPAHATRSTPAAWTFSRETRHNHENHPRRRRLRHHARDGRLRARDPRAIA